MQAGQRIGRDGRYVLERQLGEGGMAVVWRAADTQLSGAPVVIKVLRPQLQERTRIRERFRNEAECQARLSHPNIVRTTDWIDDGEHLAMVMQFVDGPDLEELLLRRGGRLDAREAWDLIEPVFDAIAEANRFGVVHRDIKPQNILVRFTGSRASALVTDFGVAKVLSGTAAGQTVYGTVMGTPAYMAPEQAIGRVDIDQRVDVFALGVTLYRALTGTLPFGEGEEALRRARGGPPVPVSTLAKGVPPDVDRVLAGALAFEREARYGSVDALREALSGAFHERPAAPRTVLESVAPTAPSVQTHASDERQQRQRQPRPTWLVPAAAVAVAVLVGIGVVAAVASPGGAPSSGGESTELAQLRLETEEAQRRALVAEKAAAEHRALAAKAESERAGLQPSTPTRPPASGHDAEMLEVARRHFRAINGCDLDALMADIDSDLRYYGKASIPRSDYEHRMGKSLRACRVQVDALAMDVRRGGDGVRIWKRGQSRKKGPFCVCSHITMRQAGGRWVITGTFDDPGDPDYSCSKRSEWCGL